MNRNVVLLSCSMALGLAGAPVIVLLGGILGASLAPSPTWATLPVASMVVGLAVCTVPAALAMERAGRRRGFMAASTVTAAASLLGIYAISSASFGLFCVVSLFIGGNLAFVQQYRFAAAESVEAGAVHKAVSYVLLGGVAAAFLGPELAKQTRALLPFGLYSGSFAALAVLGCANTGILYFLRDPRPHGSRDGRKGRPLRDIVTQPLYMAAVAAVLVAFGVMSFIMTATPVSMHIIDGFSIDETAWVIQSHVMAMYVPSLFTGALIGRYGLVKIMTAGTLLMIACALLALVNRHFVHYWAGLVLLGVGWNFLFIGGTTLLTRTYSPAESFKAQAVNDCVVFGFQALASLSAGTIIFRAGWEVLNAATIPLMIIMLLVIANLRNVIDERKRQGS
jgi:predicted MFS family arabinose efflux permease